jgi:hypothetical protein
MFSDMKKFLPQGSDNNYCELTTDKGISILELKDLLGIPKEKRCVVTINDTNRRDDFVLEDRDLVKIFPVAMGG